MTARAVVAERRPAAQDRVQRQEQEGRAVEQDQVVAPAQAQELRLDQLLQRRGVVLAPELVAQVQALAPETVQRLAQDLQRALLQQAELMLVLGPRPEQAQLLPLHPSGTPTIGAAPGPAPMTKRKPGPNGAPT